MNVKIDNRLNSFSASVKNVMGDAIRGAASDLLTDAKNHAPYKDGGLRANTEIDRLDQLKYKVWFNIEYAAFQEAGGNKKRRVRNYTTAGTGKDFLKNAGDAQSERMDSMFKRHAGRAKA